MRRAAIASGAPWPRTIVVSDWVDQTASAEPRSSRGDVLELAAEVAHDDAAAGQDREVLHHRLAPVAVLRRMHHEELARRVAAEDRGQHGGRAILGDDHQRPAVLLGDAARGGDLLRRGQLEVGQHDVGLHEVGAHRLLVGDEVVRDVAAVERHALDDVDMAVDADGEVGGDDALGADGAIGVGDQRAELAVVRGDVGDDCRAAGPSTGIALERSASSTTRTARSMPWHRSTALAPREVSSTPPWTMPLASTIDGGGAVAGDLVGLHRDFAHHLRAHVLEAVEQLDLGGDRDAVAGDQRRADRPVDHRVHALGAERRLDGGGEALDAARERLAGFVAVDQDLGHVFLRLFLETGLSCRIVGRAFSRPIAAAGRARAGSRRASVRRRPARPPCSGSP